MVTGLYSQMRSKNLTEIELGQACRSEPQVMFCRISTVKLIPASRVQLEKLYVPVSTEKVVAHINRIKALLKANCTRH